MNRYWHAVLVALLAVALATGSAQSQAVLATKAGAAAVRTFLKAGRAANRAVPDSDILKFASRASNKGGTADIAEELVRRGAGADVIEDTYARILVAQNHVGRAEAETWIRHLSGTPGFADAMKKSMGASEAQTIGHLTEIRIAESASQHGFVVKEISRAFKDPNLSRPTDIDVVAEYGGREVAIESKNYSRVTGDDLINFRGDMQSLNEYRRANPNRHVLPVFWMVKRPADPTVAKRLEATAKVFEVKVVYGDPSFGIHQLHAFARGTT